MSLKSRMNNVSPMEVEALPSVTAGAGLPSRNVVEPEYLTGQFLSIKTQIQNVLLEEIANPEELRRDELMAHILRLVESNATISPLEKDALARGLVNEILGFGPIQPFLDDPSISEVMVNGPDHIYVESQGKMLKTSAAFRDEAHLRTTLEKMLAFSGRHIDDSSPMVDARLPDGSRLNAVLRPVSVVGDSITIRKFAKDPFVLAQLVQIGTLSEAMAAFLELAVRGKLNVVVSGGTGSGKTTTLNALSAFIPGDERIVTIEDAAELQLQQDHRVSLEARPANIEGRGMIAIRDLVRNALRMRPDRIVVGEVRGGEALDMLQAMNTGHEGSLTTVHANNPRDCLGRLETMVLMAGLDLPLAAIRAQIASALNVIVQQARMLDGTRKIIRITEVVGMESGVVTTQDLFFFNQTGVIEDGKVAGEFLGTGIRPASSDRLRANGIVLPNGLFSEGGSLP